MDEREIRSFDRLDEPQRIEFPPGQRFEPLEMFENRFERLDMADWAELRDSGNPFGPPKLEWMLGALLAEIRAMRVAVQRFEARASLEGSAASESPAPAPQTAAEQPSSAPSAGRAP